MRKQLALVVSITIFLVILSSCSGGNPKDNNSLAADATKNFDYVVSNNSENVVYHDELEHFGFLMTDKDKFEWTKDPSVSDADFALSINATDFINAGLDVTKLDKTVFSYQPASGDTPAILMHKLDVSNEKVVYKDYKEAFEKLLIQIPDRLSTLEKDGYILDLGQGFQVHWNGEQRVNKDIAFIIGADELVKAGLDVNKMTGWKVMKNKDPNDKTVKLLRIFYLK